jgi:hypothetical protein
MIDKLLEVGTVFDWISPLIAAIQDRTNGPSHTFMIPDDCGWSGFQIEHLLKGYGVKLWRKMVVNHSIMVTVRLSQAHYAQDLLLRAQIPIEYGMLDERSRQPGTARRERRGSTARSASRPAAKQGLWAEVSRAVNGLVDELEAMLGLRP